MSSTNKALREALREIRELALEHLGPGYPQTLPLGVTRIHKIVQLATVALERGGKVPS